MPGKTPSFFDENNLYMPEMDDYFSQISTPVYSLDEVNKLLVNYNVIESTTAKHISKILESSIAFLAATNQVKRFRDKRADQTEAQRLDVLNDFAAAIKTFTAAAHTPETEVEKAAYHSAHQYVVAMIEQRVDDMKKTKDPFYNTFHAAEDCTLSSTLESVKQANFNCC